jgi:hypothetical protein
MFLNYLAEIHSGVGEPESAARFTENHITTLRKKDCQAGDDLERDFIEVMSDCQFDGFVLGFNTAVKFLLGCAMERGVNL